MRLPSFSYLAPQNIEEALELLDRLKEKAALIAGGTDLLPRMKKRLSRPSYLISLRGLRELDYIREEEGSVRIGSRTLLSEVLESELIKKRYPALVQAVRSIGAPPIQHFRGTLGGNLCQDTRCLFYNQSAFWRSGRQPCHKAGGQTCYAEENSDRCRSANQSDGASTLMALNARVRLVKKGGARELALEEFFTGKGETPLVLEANELLAEIQIPVESKGHGSAYHRLSYRSAIDYPLVSAAAALKVDDGVVVSGRLVVGAAAAMPLYLKEVSERLSNMKVSDEEMVEDVARKAMSHASPFMVENLGAPVSYRRKMIAVMVKRALEEAIAKAVAQGSANAS